MASRIKLRRDTSANWVTANPILAAGETGFETDTRMIKLGDGATHWNNLPYAVTGDLQITNSNIAGKTEVNISAGSGDEYTWIASIDGSEGSPNNDDPWPVSPSAVAYDSMGNAYMTYWYENTGGGMTGASVVKVDKTGGMMWNQYFQEYAIASGGLTIDKNDDVIISVTETSTSGSNISVVLKLHGQDGTIAWQTGLTDVVQNYSIYLDSIVTDSAGNVFVAGGSTPPGSSYPSVWVIKINGSTGGLIWNNSYSYENAPFGASTGIAVDSSNNIAVLGVLAVGGPYSYAGILKADGNTGAVIWVRPIVYTAESNANNSNTGLINPADIASDNLGNFYVSFSAQDAPNIYSSNITKISGDGTFSWSRQVGLSHIYDTVGTVTCDSDNNVYFFTNVLETVENVGRYIFVITKFNPNGTVIWNNSFFKEQDSESVGYTYPESFNNQGIEKLLAVNSDYLLIGGTHYTNDSYTSYGEQYYGFNRAYMAQVDKNGDPIDVDGWHFAPFAQTSGNDDVIVPINVGTFTTGTSLVSTTTSNVTITTSSVVAYVSTDGVIVEQLDVSRTKTLTYANNQLSLTPGGTIDIPREQLGYVDNVGNFDGYEGANNQGDMYFNTVKRDMEGNSYATGIWYNQDNTVSGQTYSYIPLLIKFDSAGKALWKASSFLITGQSYGTGSVDAAIRSDGSLTWVTLDGNEGFNITNLNNVSGNTTGVAYNVASDQGGQASGEQLVTGDNLYPNSLALMSDNTPVVVGYIQNNTEAYKNVTNGGTTTSTGTTDSILVIPKSTFNGNYPDESGKWHVLNTNTTVYNNISYVNRYGYTEGGIDPTDPAQGVITTTSGSGALFWIGIDPTAEVYQFNLYNGGGTAYMVGDTATIYGSLLGGTSGTNNLSILVSTVDPSSGAITSATITGVVNSATIKLDMNGVDFGFMSTPLDTFNVYEQTDNDGFIWTPNWSVAIGGTSTYDSLGSVTIDSQDNVIVGGYYDNIGVPNSSGYGPYANNVQTSMVVKYSSTGSQQWAITLDGIEGNQNVYGLVTDSSDNIYALTRRTWPILTKISSTGTVYWQTAIKLAQSSYDQTVRGLAIDENDNLYVNGHAYVYGDIPNQGPNTVAGKYVSIDGAEGLVTWKFDSDGNKLFERNLVAGTYYLNNSYYQPFGSTIDVSNGRMSLVGYTPYADGYYDAVIADLPADGAGTGTIGDYYVYQNSETNIDQFNEFFNPARDNLIGRPFTPQTRSHIFTVTNYNTETSLTIYVDRQVKTFPAYDNKGGAITSVASITFEDGTTQSTTAQDIPQSNLQWTNYGDYTIQLQDRGRHIYNNDSNNRRYYVPPDRLVDFPIGSVITFVSTDGELYIYSWSNNEAIIYGAGQSGQYVNGFGYYWTLPAWGIATLLKVDANTWMLSGTGITKN